MAAVMVMDDDEPSRALLAEWLAGAGHEVHQASSHGSLGANSGASVGGTAVDLVLIDLPRLRHEGAALLARVRAAHPDAALLGLCTQVRESLAPESALAGSLGLRRLLAKPCSRQELLAAAADALAARRAG